MGSAGSGAESHSAPARRFVHNSGSDIELAVVSGSTFDGSKEVLHIGVHIEAHGEV